MPCGKCILKCSMLVCINVQSLVVYALCHPTHLMTDLVYFWSGCLGKGRMHKWKRDGVETFETFEILVFGVNGARVSLVICVLDAKKQ